MYSKFLIILYIVSGYQNAIVLDPTGQAGLGARGGHVSLAYPRPLDFGYHNPDPALAYQ